MAGNDHDISILNGLIALTIDSANGFGRSAENADADSVRAMFRDFADARRQIVARLQDRVRQLGGTPDDGGSLSAQVHRRWDDLWKAIAGRNDEAVVKQVERDEAYIASQYAAVLEDRSLSPPTRAVIEQCYKSIARGDTVRRLKQSVQRADA